MCYQYSDFYEIRTADLQYRPSHWYVASFVSSGAVLAMCIVKTLSNPSDKLQLSRECGPQNPKKLLNISSSFHIFLISLPSSSLFL